MLPAGKKVKFEKEYSLNGFNRVIGCNMILRIMRTDSDERTEYSIKNVGGDSWKVLL